MLSWASNGDTRRSNSTPDGRGDINFTPQVDQRSRGSRQAFAAWGSRSANEAAGCFATTTGVRSVAQRAPPDQRVIARQRRLVAFVTYRIN
jgi:hypothetical protein